jgi:hypothetical protein
LDRIELWCVGRQKRQLDIDTLGFDVIADPSAAMGLQTKRSSRPGELAAEIEEDDSSGVTAPLADEFCRQPDEMELAEPVHFALV